jgi:hypothetical protein
MVCHMGRKVPYSMASYTTLHTTLRIMEYQMEKRKEIVDEEEAWSATAAGPRSQPFPHRPVSNAWV